LVLTLNAIQAGGFIGINVGASIAIVFATSLSVLIIVFASVTWCATWLSLLIVVFSSATCFATWLIVLVLVLTLNAT
jgi:hypothetical protein